MRSVDPRSQQTNRPSWNLCFWWGPYGCWPLGDGTSSSSIKSKVTPIIQHGHCKRQGKHKDKERKTKKERERERESQPSNHHMHRAITSFFTNFRVAKTRTAQC